MIKVFKVADIHQLIKQVTTEEITYGRMVEIMNEMSNEAHLSQNSKIPCVSNWIACSNQILDDEKRKELTENFYWLNLQNLSGREEFDEAFRLGIMTGIDELSEWLQEGN